MRVNGWTARSPGVGVAVYANGVRYEGEFQNAMHHGQGTMTSPGGYIYEGTWVNGVKEGQGKINLSRRVRL